MGCGLSSAPVVGVPVADAPVDEEETELNPVPNPPADHQRRACRYGDACYRRNAEHLKDYVHPGDRNYRNGFVTFGQGKGPEFQTLWQLFTFFDSEETGYLNKEEFLELSVHVVKMQGGDDSAIPEGPEAAWETASQAGLHLSFSRFSEWAEPLSLGLPLGVDNPDSSKPCRFKFSGVAGSRCSCANYKVGEDGLLCTCGHKPSMHRSDNAELSMSEIRVAPDWWTNAVGDAAAELILPETVKECADALESPDEGREEKDLPTASMASTAVAPKVEGLVRIEDQALLDQLQALLLSTHKTEDNWTRDRGCQLHGRNGDGCSFSCAFKNRVPVPSEYKLRAALRNQNLDLWMKYFTMRSSIADECAGNKGAADDYEDVAVASQTDLDAPLIPRCNEWRLFHGTRIEACQGICSSNFRLSLAGTGATWKDPGQEKGSPLYGFGIYLAERCTKADEYSEQVPSDALAALVGSEGASELADAEVYCMLLARCVGGRTNVITTNDIDKEKLKGDVFDGPFHSVFGDRVASLGKPYKEIVVYDKDQVYPEMLLLYERVS
eukprot:TRINITY_DN47199_c0_g1_i1.p1 TRINITY_DN47199_c0_g1~~TRINITY_DN47199_c0_g1_i1.p1  ORF type:complete len:553 (-),score=86.07 TRINITY_DN47199_c0_g1_i1:82-1740(-)